jgi:hypothetical protein
MSFSFAAAWQKRPQKSGRVSGASEKGIAGQFPHSIRCAVLKAPLFSGRSNAPVLNQMIREESRSRFLHLRSLQWNPLSSNYEERASFLSVRICGRRPDEISCEDCSPTQ